MVAVVWTVTVAIDSEEGELLVWKVHTFNFISNETPMVLFESGHSMRFTAKEFESHALLSE